MNVATTFRSDSLILNSKSTRMRIFDWIFQIQSSYDLLDETVHLTFNIIDRLRERSDIQRSEVHLMAITACFVASKYEQIYPPSVREFLYLTRNKFSVHSVYEMERRILRNLDYELLIVNPVHLVERFHNMSSSWENKKLLELSRLVFDLSCLFPESLSYKKSKVVFSCLLVARAILRVKDDLDGIMEKYCRLKKNNMMPYLRSLGESIKKFKDTGLSALKDKYSTSRKEKVWHVFENFLQKSKDSS